MGRFEEPASEGSAPSSVGDEASRSSAADATRTAVIVIVAVAGVGALAGRIGLFPPNTNAATKTLMMMEARSPPTNAATPRGRGGVPVDARAEPGCAFKNGARR